MKNILSYGLILIAVIIIRTFIVTPVMVNGDSMYSTLKDNQLLLLKKYDHSFERGEIIVFNYNNSKLVKRVIGMPGETIKYEDGNLYINDNLIEDEFSKITKDYEYEGTIPENHYFVLGDNRNYSLDSRIIGPIKKDDIVGATSFSLWPIKTIK